MDNSGTTREHLDTVSMIFTQWTIEIITEVYPIVKLMCSRGLHLWAVLGKDASSRKRSVGLLILGQYMRYDEPHHNTPISLLDLKLMKWRKIQETCPFLLILHSDNIFVVSMLTLQTDPVFLVFGYDSVLYLDQEVFFIFFQVHQGQFMISYMKCIYQKSIPWQVPLKMKLSSGHAIALWKKRCGIDQKGVDHLSII